MHPDHVHTVSFAAALLAGLAGSMHCLAMCGGMAGALGMRAKASGGSHRQALLYQAGRIGGYTVAGALVSAFGATALHAFDLGQLSFALRVASGIFIVLVGSRLLLRWNPLAPLERWGARFWQRLRPLAQRAARGNDTASALWLGFLWGWLPCGLVYSMLLFAAMSGNVRTGAGIMLAFGLGTLPSMLAGSFLAAQLQRLLSSRWPRLASGAALVTFGVWIAVAGLQVHAGGHVH